MHNRSVFIVLFAVLSLAAVDVYLLGKIHFAHLWLTREHDPKERRLLEKQATILTYVLVTINLGGISALAFALSARARTRRKQIASEQSTLSRIGE